MAGGGAYHDLLTRTTHKEQLANRDPDADGTADVRASVTPLNSRRDLLGVDAYYAVLRISASGVNRGGRVPVGPRLDPLAQLINPETGLKSRFIEANKGPRGAVDRSGGRPAIHTTWLWPENPGG